MKGGSNQDFLDQDGFDQKPCTYFDSLSFPQGQTPLSLQHPVAVGCTVVSEARRPSWQKNGSCSLGGAARIKLERCRECMKSFAKVFQTGL